MCSFHTFLSILVVMATLFVSLKILIAYFYSQLKFLDFLHRTEISAILVDVCLNSVAMVNLLVPYNFR